MTKYPPNIIQPNEEFGDDISAYISTLFSQINEKDSLIQDLLSQKEEDQQKIAEQAAKISQLQQHIAELEGQLNQNSRNSNRPPSQDGFKRAKSQRKKGERSPGGQKGHPGQTLEIVEKPDQIENHTATECNGCGASLQEIKPNKVERRQVHDVPPLVITVTEHRVEHTTCPHCGQHNQGEFPPDVKYPVQYGMNLKALMVYLCIYQLLPYDRACETFADLFGRSISKATLVKAVSDCYQNLAGFEERIRDLLAGANVLNVDETGMRVNGVRQWLHVASTELLTWYGHHRKRGSQAMDEMQILTRFKGVMVHDFWAPYFRYLCWHALCNAHLLRELMGISENFGQNWCGQLYDLLLEIKQCVDSVQEYSSGLSDPQISVFLEKYRHIIEMGLHENPMPENTDHIVKRGRKRQSKAKNLLDRCQKYQREILSFMYDFSVPFTNNQAERDLRMMKLQQKISGTFRSDDGATWFCRVRGYISTVKKNQVPVLTSLVNAFEGNPFVPTDAHRSG